MFTHFMPLISFDTPWFSDVFRVYQKRSVAWNGLNKFHRVSIQLISNDSINTILLKENFSRQILLWSSCLLILIKSNIWTLKLSNFKYFVTCVCSIRNIVFDSYSLRYEKEYRDWGSLNKQPERIRDYFLRSLQTTGSSNTWKRSITRWQLSFFKRKLK